ncbi:MAG: 3'(2'),5'-bisphosphate nucleotidase CysQ, partial [Actinomycetota bacterium]|nr:3'(2'),5'-bisphosphate nucleotidase CysQ [Actinomycetota bacterium]
MRPGTTFAEYRCRADAALARDVAAAAGRVLLRVRGEGRADDVGDRGDAAAQQAIGGMLGRARLQDAILSEEASDDPARLDADRVWIIDPLDGTREFAQRGRSDWGAVHVALWERGELGDAAVALPGIGLTLGTD